MHSKEIRFPTGSVLIDHLLPSIIIREPVAVATMTSGNLDSVPLDLFFSEYIELTLQVLCFVLNTLFPYHSVEVLTL